VTAKVMFCRINPKITRLPMVSNSTHLSPNRKEYELHTS
jgi:hypothetical protein